MRRGSLTRRGSGQARGGYVKRVGDEKTGGKLTNGGDGSPSARMEILTHACGDYLPSGCLSNQKSGFSEGVSV